MVDQTMLQFDYDLARGRVVTAVLGSDAGSGALDSLAVVTAESALVLRVHPDTDELIVDFEPAPVLGGQWRAVDELSSIKGSELGWCWVGRNYLGYLDMFTLSFSGLDPQYCFMGEASNITIRRLSPAS
jgi:hypothetical protein